MQYKTIVLELLKQQTELYEQLRIKRKLMPTLEICAKELKTSHQAWKETLKEAKPESDPSQVSSEALEMALKELTDRLASASRQNENQCFRSTKSWHRWGVTRRATKLVAATAEPV